MEIHQTHQKNCVRNMGIYGCWRMTIICLGHGNHTYVIAVASLSDSMLMCIKHINNFMLGGEISHISNFALRNSKFLVQWYDFHIMHLISYDDNLLWWILMFGYLQLRKWDLGIILYDNWCWKESH